MEEPISGGREWLIGFVDARIDFSFWAGDLFGWLEALAVVEIKSSAFDPMAAMRQVLCYTHVFRTSLQDDHILVYPAIWFGRADRVDLPSSLARFLRSRAAVVVAAPDDLEHQAREWFLHLDAAEDSCDWLKARPEMNPLATDREGERE